MVVAFTTPDSSLPRTEKHNKMLCESSLRSMGYQEHIQQIDSHPRGIVLRELVSDHGHSTDQNVHLYKPQRIPVYTRWFGHSRPSESHHAERGRTTTAQTFMKSDSRA
ncbi:hypothetical protein PDJAM_G00154060 [Pangasius djambal]|uniref:Uncharacterized protein n=1 Tax=Pangasius djambal TaxID=1691987 RepID=A0ACC5ZH46_9TELE|nr:hypothetical protein [Pangasius djambal]